MIDRNHPAVTRCFPDGNIDPHVIMAETFAEVIRDALPHLTAADLPARLVRDIQVRTLRDAAHAVTHKEGGIPWYHDWDRDTTAAWLEDLADNIEYEKNHD